MSHGRLAFGRFILNAEAGTLLREGEPVPVGYRAFLLLTAFLNRPGEVLTKSDLIDATWQGAAVEETNLSVQIASLRKHLGQAPEGGGEPRVQAGCADHGVDLRRAVPPAPGGARAPLYVGGL